MASQESGKRGRPSVSVPANISSRLSVPSWSHSVKREGSVQAAVPFLSRLSVPHVAACRQVPIHGTARHPWTAGPLSRPSPSCPRRAQALLKRRHPVAPSLLGQRCDATWARNGAGDCEKSMGPPCTVPGDPGRRCAPGPNRGGGVRKKVTPWASIWHFHRTVPAMSHPLIIRRPSPRPPSSLPPGSHIISSPHLATASWFRRHDPSHPSLSLSTHIVTHSTHHHSRLTPTLEHLPRSSQHTPTRTHYPNTTLVPDDQLPRILRHLDLPSSFRLDREIVPHATITWPP